MPCCKKYSFKLFIPHKKKRHYIKHWDGYKLLTYNTITYNRNLEKGTQQLLTSNVKLKLVNVYYKNLEIKKIKMVFKV